MLFSAFLITIGIVLTILMSLTADMVEVFLPQRYKAFSPLVITVIGIVVGGLRSITTTPIYSNVPDIPPIPPIPPLPPAGQ